MKNKFIPFSKKNIIYARLEAYVFSLILIILVIMEKDVTPIAILLTLSWGGYKMLQAFYIKMAEKEHLETLRNKRLSKNMDTSDLDVKIEEVENKDLTELISESEVY